MTKYKNIKPSDPNFVPTDKEDLEHYGAVPKSHLPQEEKAVYKRIGKILKKVIKND